MVNRAEYEGAVNALARSRTSYQEFRGAIAMAGAAVGPFYAGVPPMLSPDRMKPPTLYFQGEKRPMLTIDDVAALLGLADGDALLHQVNLAMRAVAHVHGRAWPLLLNDARGGRRRRR